MRTRRAPLRQILSDIIYGIDAGNAIRHGLPPRPRRAAVSSHRDQGPRTTSPRTVSGGAPHLHLAPWTWEAAAPSRN